MSKKGRVHSIAMGNALPRSDIRPALSAIGDQVASLRHGDPAIERRLRSIFDALKAVSGAKDLSPAERALDLRIRQQLDGVLRRMEAPAPDTRTMPGVQELALYLREHGDALPKDAYDKLLAFVKHAHAAANLERDLVFLPAELQSLVREALVSAAVLQLPAVPPKPPRGPAASASSAPSLKPMAYAPPLAPLPGPGTHLLRGQLLEVPGTSRRVVGDDPGAVLACKFHNDFWAAANLDPKGIFGYMDFAGMFCRVVPALPQVSRGAPMQKYGALVFGLDPRAPQETLCRHMYVRAFCTHGGAEHSTPFLLIRNLDESMVPKEPGLRARMPVPSRDGDILYVRPGVAPVPKAAGREVQSVRVRRLALPDTDVPTTGPPRTCGTVDTWRPYFGDGGGSGGGGSGGGGMGVGVGAGAGPGPAPKPAPVPTPVPVPIPVAIPS